ncbi:tyrosinase central domain-containing protein [Nemania sp. FL0031]|nr:tyrosinase central domain-containing protein [Nemania sp. FL0031]
MDSFDRLNHLTRPAIEGFPVLEHQPPDINTRYVIKREESASVEASNQEMQTKIWFKSPPLTAQTIRMIRGIKLFAESHDQGFIDNLREGNWSWIQLAILENEEVTSPRKGRNGQELVVISHPNKVKSTEYSWLQGETFDSSHNFLKSLEAGNVIAVRLCARFANWKIYAKDGHLVIDIGDDNNPVPITPIPINTNEPIPPRRNVEEWYEEATASNTMTPNTTGLELSLFIRAMKVFQLLPPEDQLSYYRIAGIHGYPSNVPWNMGKGPTPLKEDENTSQENGQDGSYCQHNNYLFPTWHRAYMLLFERRVSDLMMEEAVTRAKETEEWVLAAKRWRLPYWDWAVKPSLPDLVRAERICIIQSWDDQAQSPSQMEEVDNPMYRFQMPGLKPMGDTAYGNYRIKAPQEPAWEKCIGTSRHGIKDSDRWIQGHSDAEQADASLRGVPEILNRLTLKDAVFRLLTHDYSNKYVYFASTKYDRKYTAKDYLNLEYIHNTAHGVIGGSIDGSRHGHMQRVPVAAFDPIFWLHHCNIDRLLHLWQCSNPGNWFPQKRGQEVDDSPQKDLLPFHSSSEVNDFYNSNKVRHIDALNYSYDYMEDITDEFGDMIPEKSHEYINKLYGPVETAYKYSKEELDPVINVVYNRYALDGRSYAVLFFLGEVDNKVPYNQQKSLVGSIFTFSTYLTPGAITCKNCYEQQRDKILSRAQVPLTRVVPNAKRENLETAMAYFNENLKWTAVLENGDVINRERLPDLTLTLSIGKNQLQGSLSMESLFKFENYEDQHFVWDVRYLSK